MSGNRLTIITNDEFIHAFDVRRMLDSIPHIEPGTGGKVLHKRAMWYLLALFSCMWQFRYEIIKWDADWKVYRLHVRQFARFMGMDAAAGKSTDIMAALTTLEGYRGFIKGKVLDVFEVKTTEDEDHEVVLSLPYLHDLMDSLQDQKYESTNPVVHDHVSATICKARCVPAADLALSLIHTLVTRGLKPEGQFKKNQGVKLADRQVIVSRVNKETLIDRVPSVRQIEYSSADTDNKNIQMRRVFLAADKLLHDQTDIFEYYKDLQIIGFTAPKLGRKRAAEMEQNIVMRHYGANDLTEKKNAADQTTGGTTAG